MSKLTWGESYSEIVELLETSGFYFIQDRGFSGDSFFMEVEYDGEYRTYRLYIRYSNDEGRAWGSQGISIRSQDPMRFVNAIDRVVSTKIVQGGNTSGRERTTESIRERRDRYREREEQEKEDTAIHVPRVSEGPVSEEPVSEKEGVKEQQPQEQPKKPRKKQKQEENNEQVENEQVKEKKVVAGEEVDTIGGKDEKDEIDEIDKKDEIDKNVHEVPAFDADAIKEQSREAAKSIEDPELREYLLKKLDKEA